jgi:hypothetical protein
MSDPGYFILIDLEKSKQNKEQAGVMVHQHLNYERRQAKASDIRIFM